MTVKEAYKVWASNNNWSGWVRPVPFIDIDKYKVVNEFINYDIPNIEYIKDVINGCAIFIDDNGVDSIKEGLALAKIGYRPIPVFNGTNPNMGSISTVNNAIISNVLLWASEELSKIKIDESAPPVFLLDKNRLNRYKANRGIFDNSWDIYSQDLPTHKFLKENGITKVIVKSNKINRDLAIILYKYQKNNIKILHTSGFEEPHEIKIHKPKKERY